MPSSYVPMDAEEMEYVDGGQPVYYDTGSAYNYANDLRKRCYILVATTIVTATLAGETLGGTFGAFAGAIGGIIAGSILWGWASAWESACYNIKELQKKGRIYCWLKWEHYGTSVYTSVW